MIILDTTVVNVAFPTVRGEFKASLSDSQFILSIYVLALGIGTPLAGFLGDRFTFKRVYITGLIIFVTGSLLCGFAPSLWLLVAARALQGFGGGLSQPLATALLFASFPVEEQGRALGYFGIVLLVAPALGPILGGFLVDQDAWRYIFFINIPIGIVGALLAWRWLRARDERPQETRLDPVGLATAVIGFSAVLYAASTAEQQGWTAPITLIGFGIGVVALIIFAVTELFYANDPLLNLKLYRNYTFAVAAVVGYITTLALFGAEFLLPIYLQTLRGQTAFDTGLILLPLGITAGIVTPIAGRLYDKIGPRPLVVVGFGVLVINTWQLSKLQADTSITWLLFLLALRGFALGCTLQSTLTASLGAVPKAQLPRGSSLVNATRRVVQSLGVALLATVLASSLSPQTRQLQQQVQSQAAQQPGSEQQFALCNAQTNSLQNVQAAQQACDQYLSGLERAYRYTFYFAIAAVIVSAFLPGWPFAWEGRGAQSESGAAAD